MVLIDIDMPVSCTNCPAHVELGFSVVHDNYCFLSQNNIPKEYCEWDSKTKPDWCLIKGEYKERW